MSRSSKKGPFVEERLLARIQAMNDSGKKQMIRTWSRIVDRVPRHGRPHDRGARRQEARAGLHLGADGRPQARRVRADPSLPRPRGRLEDAGEAVTAPVTTCRPSRRRCTSRRARRVSSSTRSAAAACPRRARSSRSPRAPPRATSRRCCAARSPTAYIKHGWDGDDLYVKAAFVDEGVTIKRWRARARGRVNRILKRTCHITIKLDQLEEASQQRQRGAQKQTRARKGGTPAARPRRSRRLARRRRWLPDGSESASRRPAGRRHPRLEVELDGRQEGVRGRAARGSEDPRAHPQEALARGPLRHPDPQGQAADHDRHLHGAPRHRHRQVGRRGRRAAQRGARA